MNSFHTLYRDDRPHLFQSGKASQPERGQSDEEDQSRNTPLPYSDVKYTLDFLDRKSVV